MMEWPGISSRGTIERRLFYFKYADPDAVQIYQGFALSIVALCLFGSGLAVGPVAQIQSAWVTSEYYAIAATCLALACLTIDPKSGGGVGGCVLLGVCWTFWVMMLTETFVRFGFAPVAHALVTFMAMMALYGCTRLMPYGRWRV